jgi:hypothetical protein
MTTINQRIIGLAESQRNRKVLHLNPTFGIHNVPYDRYQNKKIFQMKGDEPVSINKRIGTNINYNLIARPCESINSRSNNRQAGGFKISHYETNPNNGLSPSFFTSDRLYFTSDLKQKPVINKLY